VSPEWLTEVLFQSGCLPQGQVVGVRITSELSYTSTIARLVPTYSADAPPTVPKRLFLKLSRSDSEQRVVGSRQRRREVEFHTKVAAFMPSPPIVCCHQAVYCQESGASHLLFDDVSESHIAGKSSSPPPVHQAERAMDAFAEFHAFWWDHQTLGEFDAVPTHKSVAEDVTDTRKHFSRFADFLNARLTGPQRQVYERTLASLPRLWERVIPGKGLSLIHGDANFSNVLLPHDPDHESALIIDWQLWGVSFATMDLAHLIALFWGREHRQTMEKKLLMRYHQSLIRHGVEGYDWVDCWQDYRLSVLLRVLFMPMWFWLSGSPDSLWERSLERAMQAVEDLGCLDLLDR